MGENDGVDQGIGEGEFVLDEEIGGGDGDFLIDGDDDAGAHGLGDFVGLFQAPLFESHLADFRDDDARDEQGGELVQNGAEMNRVGAGVEAFKPTAGIEKIELHGAGKPEVVRTRDPARARIQAVFRLSRTRRAAPE